MEEEGIEGTTEVTGGMWVKEEEESIIPGESRVEAESRGRRKEEAQGMRVEDDGE